jgi:Tfp pilus assembly protein PilF
MPRRTTLLMVIACTLLAWEPAGAASPQPWFEARSAHFTVLTDSGEKDAVRLASHFERMRLVLKALLPADDDSVAGPMTVLAVKGRKELQALEPAAYLGRGKMDLAGLFAHSVDEDYIVVRVDAEEAHAYSPVYHEYTHAMLRKASAWMPLWLNEGLAQFYENTDFDEKAIWVGEANAGQLKLLNRNDLLPMKTLLTVDAGSALYHEEDMGSIFYAQSWALTHYLMVSDRLQKMHRLRDYAELLAGGEDAVTAARQAFGDLDKLQAGLDEYVMQRKFMYFTMPAELVDEKSIAVRQVSGPEADAVRADMMAQSGREREAKALVAGVLRDDPKQAMAHETMGYLRYRDGDFEAAKLWFAQAVTLEPGSARAHFYLAAAMERAGGTGDDAAVEGDLREAIRLNPEFAPAYDGLAMFHARRHSHLDEAQRMSARAVALEPGELSFRLDSAEVMTESQEFADALGVLRDAMHLAKNGEETAAVRDRMSRVERYQTASARSLAGARSVSGYGQ